jgi:hypothetical protein
LGEILPRGGPTADVAHTTVVEAEARGDLRRRARATALARRREEIEDVAVALRQLFGLGDGRTHVPDSPRNDHHESPRVTLCKIRAPGAGLVPAPLDVDEYSNVLYNRVDGKGATMEDGRVPTTFRLTPETRRLLAELARLLDKSQRAVIEEIIRQRAKREGVR